MGLDMYLQKAPRFKGISFESVKHIERYLMKKQDELEGKFEDFITSYMKEVKGKNKEVMEYYISEFQKLKYCTWDMEKKFGFCGIFSDVATWRKANCIHLWFVQNVQDGYDDCDDYEVTKEDLSDLLDLCKRVKGSSKMVPGKLIDYYFFKDGKRIPHYVDGLVLEDDNIAKELLPTCEGFYFGGTDYDQYYMENIDYTIKVLEKVLKETDFSKEIICYSSSW